MAEFLKKTVKPSDGDYTSLEACLNANEQDLTGDGYFTVEIDGDWSGGADTSAVTIHNYTCPDADNNIRISTTSQAFHRGIWSTSKYMLSTSGLALSIASVNYVTITGIQVTNPTSFVIRGVGSTNAILNKIFINSTASHSYSGISAFGTNLTIKNCIIYLNCAGGNYPIAHTSGIVTHNIYNSIVINKNSSNNNAIFLGQDTSVFNVTNCYASVEGASPVAYKKTGGTLTLTTCASSDTSGTAGLQSIACAILSGTYFTSLTAGAEDFHIRTTSPLIDVGTDLSATFTDDIDGMWRGTTWSVGVDQLVSFTVKPSGGNYTSLEACMNGNECDLTAKGYMNVEIGGTWSSADTTAVTVHNYTTDATRYINIYTTSLARHHGVYSTNYYTNEPSDSTYTQCFNIQASYTTLDGLQGYNKNTNSYRIGILGSKKGLVVKNCILKSCDGNHDDYNFGIRLDGDTGSYSDMLVYNCILLEWNQSFRFESELSYTYWKIYNNTVVTSATSDGAGEVINYNTYCYGDCYLYNNLVQAPNQKNYNISLYNHTFYHDNNISYDGYSPDTDHRNKIISFCGGGDYHLLSTDTDAIDKGTDLSATFTTDIDGQTRPTGANTWDIGADEYVGNYLTYVLKDKLGQPTTATLTGIIRTNRAPATSPVYLQAFNYNLNAWETVDSDNSSEVGTNFTLTGSIPVGAASITDYLESANWITSRIYQEKK